MKKRFLAVLLLAVTLLVQSSFTAYAITTEFMVPDIDLNDTSRSNVLYTSPNENIQVSKFSYGLVGDVLNTSGLDALLSELSANSNPSKYSNSIVGIYMEGAALSDANAKLLASEGWKKLEMYYERFLISGKVPSRGMRPMVETINDTAITDVLTNAGFTGQVGMFKISDVSMTEPLLIYYEPEFKFLRGSKVNIYKYIPDLKVFVAGPTAVYDGYDRSFMDMEGLHLSDGDPNGTFVVLKQSLPSSLVITKDQIQALRDQLSPQESEEPETEEIIDSGSTEESTEEDTQEAVVTNTDKTVAWTFADGTAPENFTAEATVEVLDEKEVNVDFAFSGKLPEGTQVTIQIPEGKVKYENGATLYFYYCNPELNEREFVSEAILKDGKVTFEIDHCSEYIITSEKLEVEVDIVEKGPDLLPIIAVFLATLFGAGVVTFIIVKKKNAN